nr:MAG TPA: hypothetical protein [Caudoviricetes sp.]
MGGGTIYGKRPSELGISDCLTGAVVVQTSTSTGYFEYVAPSDGIAWVYGTRAFFVGIRPTGMTENWTSLVRNSTEGLNISVYQYFKKGQKIQYHYGLTAGTIYCYFCPI